MNQIDKKIAELQKEINELKAQKVALAELTDEKKLAIVLHDVLCHSNHTDGCDWFYFENKGIHKWEGYAQSHYLALAGVLLVKHKAEDIENILKIIKNHR